MQILRFFCIATAVAVAAGCDDQFGPQAWSAEPDTAELFSLSRAEYQNLPSALDVVELRVVQVEQPGQTGNWDIALTEADGALQLTPAGAFPGLDTIPGIAVFPDSEFTEVTRAPADTAAFARKRSVPVVAGSVYVVRSRRFFVFSRSCVRYAKLRPVEIDAAEGTLSFELIMNPNCNDRSFVPPES